MDLWPVGIKGYIQGENLVFILIQSGDDGDHVHKHDSLESSVPLFLLWGNFIFAIVCSSGNGM